MEGLMKTIIVQVTEIAVFLLALLVVSGCASSNLPKTDILAENRSTASSEVGRADAPGAVKEGEHNHRAQKMPPKPNGVISLDVVEKNGKIYLLLGEREDEAQSLVLQASRDGGKSWSQPVAVDAGQTFAPLLTRSNDARLAVSGNNLLAFWTSFKEAAPFGRGPMAVAYSADGGQHWQPGASPADWQEGSHAFFSVDGNGKQMHAVWLDSRNGPSQIKGTQGMRHAFSRDGGKNWSQNVTLDDVTCACCWTAARLHKDALYVLYRDKQPSDMSMGVLRGQEWQHLGTVGEFNWFFEGCPHVGGGMAFGSGKNDQSVHAVIGTGLPEQSGIYYLHSDDGGKNWAQPERMGDDTGLHGDIAIDANGRLVVVWDALTDDGLAIYAAERLRNGTFTEPVKLSASGIRAAFPRVVAAGNKFLVVWTQSKDGKREELAMQHF